MGIDKQGKPMSNKQKEILKQIKLKNPVKYWLGKKRPNLNKTGAAKTMFKKGKSTRKGIKWSKEQRKMLSEAHLKGRMKITPEIKLLRSSIDYIEWRKSVLSRDDYTCQICNIRGGNLHADHIKPFAYYPDLRFNLSNGRTLCVNCHRKTDTWGGRNYLYGQ